MVKKIIILGGSKGLGKSINDKFKNDKTFNVNSFSSKDFNSSSIDSTNQFLKVHKYTDILVLNTGGPPPIPFKDIKVEDWEKYHKQLFLNFAIILQKLKISKGGYIFLISSGHIKEPTENLILSSVYRVSLASLLKSYSKIYSNEKISTINIMPLAFKTNRIKRLLGKELNNFEKNLPFKKFGNPNEIGDFIYFIVKMNIKYLNGVSINFDGGLSNSLF